MLELNLPSPLETPLRVLCLGAHCDDIEIGCGGTILTLIDRFADVSVDWCVFSSTAERAIEARRSAEIFLEGAEESKIVVKSYRDGFFPFDGGQIKDDFEALKSLPRPDLILTHCRDDRHQDHRVISDLTWNTYRDHLILEYEIPKYDGDLGQPNLFVPLQEEVCSKKIETILASYPSQGKKNWFDDLTFQSLLRLRGVESNSPSRFAEAFYCRKAVLS